MTHIIVTFEDGTERLLDTRLSDRVVGLDTDGDLLVPLGDGIIFGDGTPYLVALTWCCYASVKGSTNSPTGVVCRACGRFVAAKYGGPSTLTVPVKEIRDGFTTTEAAS